MKKTGWKQIKVKFEVDCPTLGDIKRLGKVLVDTDLSLQLSQDNHALCCLLANLILDEKLEQHPIFPKAKLKRKKPVNVR